MASPGGKLAKCWAPASLPVAAGLGAVTLATGAGAAVANAYTPSSEQGGIPSVIYPLVFTAVGLVVLGRQRQNLVAWLFLLAGLFSELNSLGSMYNVIDFRLHHGTLPLGDLSLLVQPSWAPAIMVIAICVIVFPDGRPSGRAMRWALRALLAAGAVWTVGAYAIVISTIVHHRIRMTSGGDLYQVDNPTGAWAWWSYAQDLFFVVLIGAAILWAALALARYRRLSGEARAQQKWLFAGVVIGVSTGMASIALSSSDSGAFEVLAVLAPLGLTAMPISVGVAILKFRLYDIDRVVSRTIAYILVTAVIVAAYVGLVSLGTSLLSFSSSVTVAATTLVLAAAFNPVRRQAQRVVDRRFNRARYDAEALVTSFASRLRDAMDRAGVARDLTAVIEKAVEPSQISVWTKAPSGA